LVFWVCQSGHFAWVVCQTFFLIKHYMVLL
jgi:hypothetical protein